MTLRKQPNKTRAKLIRSPEKIKGKTHIMSNTAPTNNSIEQVLKLVNRDGDTQIAANYEALVGTAYPIGEVAVRDAYSSLTAAAPFGHAVVPVAFCEIRSFEQILLNP